MDSPNLGPESSMQDSDAAWWAKCRRAEHHHEALTSLIADFKASQPYELAGEPIDQPNLRAFRLHIYREPPAEIALVIGDLLHNLRSALDAVAYGLVDQVRRDQLTEADESATTFPICETPDAFTDFFKPTKNLKAQSTRRAALYSERAKQALRVVQPFAFGEPFGIPSDKTPEQVYAEDLRRSPLHRLHRLNNIDKHRRLHTTALWPGLTGAPPGTAIRFGEGFSDGDVVGYLEGPGADEGTLWMDFVITLLDDTMEHQEDLFFTPFIPIGPGLADCLALTDFLLTATQSTIAQVLREYQRLGPGQVP